MCVAMWEADKKIKSYSGLIPRVAEESIYLPYALSK